MPGWTQFVDLFAAILGWLYDLTQSLGVGIILFTFLIRFMLLPLTLKTLRSQKKMQLLQPKLREINRKYGKDKEKATAETFKLYREEGVNPAGSCLPLLIQLPIFFAVYQAVQKVVGQPDVHNSFLWLPDLAKADPWYILPTAMIVLQFIVQLMGTPRVQDPQQEAMTRAMLIMPIFFGIFAFTFPSGAVLYWVTGTVIAIVQQYFTTGWGRLSLYLPFLPGDKGFMNRDKMREELAAMEASNPSTPAAAAEQRGFWDVLGKLATESAAAQPGDAEDQRALDDVRRQSRRRR